jgi:hypothetical protein
VIDFISIHSQVQTLLIPGTFLGRANLLSLEISALS